MYFSLKNRGQVTKHNVQCNLNFTDRFVDNPGRPSMDILVRSWQDLEKILAKIVTRYCQELQDAMVRSYQESHVSKKNPTKKPNMARKILLRGPIWQEKSN